MLTNRDIGSFQLSDVIGTVIQLTGCLRGLTSDSENPPCAEVKTSLEGTIIRACNRIDAILDHEHRWKLPEIDSHQLALIHGVFQNKVMAHQDYMLNLRKRFTEDTLTSAPADVEVEPEVPVPPTTKPSRKRKGKK